MKIYSATNKPKFKWVESEYTGGAIYVVWGQLADGNYFCGNDCEYWIFIVDENPGEYHNGEDYNGSQYLDDFEWLEKHTVKELSEKAQLEFWLDLVNYCKRSNIDFCSNNYNGLIKDIKDCLEYCD